MVIKYEYRVDLLVGDDWVEFEGDVKDIKVVKTDDGSDSCEVVIYNPDGEYAPEGESWWRHKIVPNRRMRVYVYEGGEVILRFVGLVNTVELSSMGKDIKVAMSSMYKLADKTIRTGTGVGYIIYRNKLESINKGLDQWDAENDVDWYMEDIFVDLALRCGFKEKDIKIEGVKENLSNVCFEEIEFSGTYADAFDEIREITGMEISVDGDGVIRMLRNDVGSPNVVNRRVEVVDGVGYIGRERLVVDKIVVREVDGSWVGRDKYEVFKVGEDHFIRVEGIYAGSLLVSFTYAKYTFTSGGELKDVSMKYDDSSVYTGCVVRGEFVEIEETDNGYQEYSETIEVEEELDSSYAEKIVRIHEMRPKILEINDRRIGTEKQCRVHAKNKLREGMAGLRTVKFESLIVEDIDIGDVVQIVEDVVGINEGYRVRYVEYSIRPGDAGMSVDVDHYGEILV